MFQKISHTYITLRAASCFQDIYGNVGIVCICKQSSCFYFKNSTTLSLFPTKQKLLYCLRVKIYQVIKK